MNFKLAASALALGLVALVGCSADSEEAAVTDSDLVAPMPPVKVQGAWRAKSGTATSSQWFEGVVFDKDGTFFADVNTGIMCITTPCPSSVRISGTYAVRGRSLVLSSNTGDDSPYFARYTVTRSNETTLTIKGDGFQNTLETQNSYCGEPTDCAGQGLIHPMCVGHWTCSAEQNSCGYACGITPVTESVWPADRTKLVAETRGGGFTPPAPAGSACAIGAAKYTLDIATKTLSWEVCDFTDWSTPFTLKTGSRPATTADISKLNSAMRGVKVTNEDICGADKPMLNIAVTSRSQGTKTYTDSFYACMGGGRTFVDNIDGVFSAFRTVVGE